MLILSYIIIQHADQLDHNVKFIYDNILDRNCALKCVYSVLIDC